MTPPIKTRTRLLSLVVVLCVSASLGLGQSLDDELFEDLKDPVPTQKKEDVSERQFNQQLQRELGGEDVGSRRNNPLSRTADAMRQVSERLAVKDTAAETRELQKTIIGNLDRLIDQLKNQKKKQSKGGGGDSSPKSNPGKQPNPTKPQPSQNPGKNQGGESKQSKKDAGTQLGSPAERSSGVASRDRLMQESWGSLPANVRQQMQSARPEKFLPKYCLLYTSDAADE